MPQGPLATGRKQKREPEPQVSKLVAKCHRVP